MPKTLPRLGPMPLMAGTAYLLSEVACQRDLFERRWVLLASARAIWFFRFA
jgi:hypothetical protein